MNLTQTAAVLAAVAAFDRRTLSEVDVQAWHAALADLPYEPAQAAVVKHYATETTWLMPAHLRRLVSAQRNDQAMRALPDIGGEGAGPKPSWFEAAAAAFKRGDQLEGERIIAAGRT